jgi:hypothetical protein
MKWLKGVITTLVVSVATKVAVDKWKQTKYSSKKKRK